jgi:hypothetical protein
MVLKLFVYTQQDRRKFTEITCYHRNNSSFPFPINVFWLMTLYFGTHAHTYTHSVSRAPLAANLAVMHLINFTQQQQQNRL